MLKAIIIDDEKHCIDRLNNLLSKHTHLINNVDSFSNVIDAKKGIEKIKPDLVFLDIELNESTAFDLLKSLNKIDFQIIFTTAYNKYAIEAIKFSAFDYLLKPIDNHELNKTLDRLNNSTLNNNLSLKLNALFHNTQTKPSNDKKLIITTEKETFFLNISNIIRCEADGNYAHIFLKKNKTILASKTLKYFEELLPNQYFFRTHQSHLINLKLIKKFINGTNAYVIMDDESKVTIAKRRKVEFLEKIKGLGY
jgi:two-component system LytT family response regulator